MTRKHFKLIAEALKNSNATDQVIREMANALATTNPRFNRDRFIDACQPEIVIREPKSPVKPDVSKYFADAANTGHLRYIALYSGR